MSKYGSIVEKILKAIEEEGPMTRSEIEQAINYPKSDTGAVVSRLSRPGKTIPKRLYIQGWTDDSENGRRYPRAIYALGDMPNKTKPRRNRKEVASRYRKKIRMLAKTNSVFNLGKAIR